MQKNKGVIWNTLGSTMYGANSFIMLALVSRLGTVEQAGAFGIAFTTSQLLYIVGLFGVSHYQMTDYQEKYSFIDYAKTRMASCLLMLVSCAGVILLLGFTGEKRAYTVWLTVLMLLNVVGDLYQSLFFQKNRLDLSGAALFHRTLWPLLLFCVVLYGTGNLIWAVGAQIMANLSLTLFYALRTAPPLIAQAPAKTGFPTGLIGECLPLFISLLLMNLLINASKYGIEFWMDDTAQGYYNMIFMPAQVINLCSQFLYKPLLNQFAHKLFCGKKREFLRQLGRQLALVAAATLAGCMAAYWVGIPVLEVLYRKDLSAFRNALALVVLGGGVFAACQLFYYILVILRKQVCILGVYSLALIAACGMTYLGVKRLEITGAVLSFVGVHLLILICYLFVLWRALRDIGGSDQAVNVQT